MAANEQDQKQAKQLLNDVSQVSSVVTQGKPCIKCGSTERYQPRPGKKTGACIACSKKSVKRWEKNNPQRMKEKRRRDAARERKASPLKLESSLCVECKLCAKVCPMQIRP